MSSGEAEVQQNLEVPARRFQTYLFSAGNFLWRAAAVYLIGHRTTLFEAEFCPLKQSKVALGKFSWFRENLACPLSMNLIIRKQQPPRVFAGRKQHSMLCGIRRTISHAMLGGMYIHSRTHFTGYVFSCCPVHDFLDRKISALWLLPMKERSCNEHLNCTGNIDRESL